MRRIGLVLLGLAGLLGVGACGGGGDDGGLCDLNVVSANVDAAFDHGSVDALIEAGGKFAFEVTALDGQLKDACNHMNTKLGAAQGDTTKAACDNARAAIAAKLNANPGVHLVVTVAPPVCEADLQATIECTGECDASFDATATPPTCTGGELSGMCSATCMGECTVSGSGSCTGECSGMCTGQCSGTCQGTCTGTCSAMDAQGNCVGTCTGTCTGSCSADCTGSCSGECRAEVNGSCSGSCSGDCNVAFTEPTCEGGTLDVMADADCKAACESQSSFDLECTDAQVVVTFTGTAANAADVTLVLEAIEENYPDVLDVAVRFKAIFDASADLAGAAKNAADDAAKAGVSAVACLAEAADAALTAFGTVQVDVNVTVEVNASVTGSGGT